MNRLWNLWCNLSGADAADSRAKMTFNIDRRVASLSSLPPTLVEPLALLIWEARPGQGQEAFLTLWSETVAREQRTREAEVDALRQRDEIQRRVEVEAAEQERFEQEARRLRQIREAEDAQRRREVAETRETQRLSATAWRRVSYLYNITAVANVASIARRGILCHEEVKSLDHDDMSDPGVQSRRGGRPLVGGRLMHEHASLYFNPRNAMLYRLLKEDRDLVVLRVSSEVLALPGVVVTDGNAASGATQSWFALDGLHHVPLEPTRVYAHHWDGDEDLKRTTQAEALVPKCVDPRFILGFIAPSEAILERVQRVAPKLRGTVDPVLFFSQ